MIVVSNSSPLIALGRIQHLDILPSLFTEITVPTAVYKEVVVNGVSQPGASALAKAEWMTVQPVRNTEYVAYLLSTLDQGEAEAILLAQELRANWLLLDEIKARTVARRLSLRVIGVAGVLVLAKQQQLIPAVKPLLDSLLLHNFRISQQVYQSAVAAAGEQL